MEVTMIVLVAVGVLLVPANLCPLPLTTGTWYSSTRGTWTVSADQQLIQDYRADLTIRSQTASLECINKVSDKYILKASFEIFFGIFVDVYTCLEFIKLSSNSFVYYVVTATDVNTGEEFTSYLTSACSNSVYKTATNRHVAVLASDTISVGITCPNVMLGKYDVECDVMHNATVRELVDGVSLGVCDEADKKLLIFNTTDLAFTAGNTLTCLDYVSSGSYVYLHTYNNDTSISGTNHRFACWVINNVENPAKTGLVEATVYPGECVSGQTPTSTPYEGQVFRLTLKNYDDFCGEISEEACCDSNVAAIVGPVVGCILIAGIFAGICLYFKKGDRQEMTQNIANQRFARTVTMVDHKFTGNSVASQATVVTSSQQPVGTNDSVEKLAATKSERHLTPVGE